MPRKLYTVGLIIAISLSLAGCKTRNRSSEAKYGHLDSDGFFTGKDWKWYLIDAVPGHTIEACGFRSKEILSAAIKWAKAIGRDQNLIFRSSEKCDEGERPPGVHRLTGYTIEESKSWCKPNTIASSSSLGGLPLFTYNINFCVDLKPEVVEKVVLHEVGHMWGLCDQYTSKNDVKMGHNCDAKYNNDRAYSGVMSAVIRPMSLTPDDILGIRILACRKDLNRHGWDSNSAWMKVMGHQVANWNGVRDEIMRLAGDDKDLFHSECY